MTMQTFVQDSNPNSPGSWNQSQAQTRLALGATATTKVGIHCQGVVTWDGSTAAVDLHPSICHFGATRWQPAHFSAAAPWPATWPMAEKTSGKSIEKKERIMNYGMIILDSPNSYHPIMRQSWWIIYDNIICVVFFHKTIPSWGLWNIMKWATPQKFMQTDAKFGAQMAQMATVVPQLQGLW